MACQECEEQARLLGMGSERELKLMAENTVLRKQIEVAREKAYDAGWIKCAEWAERIDLISDCDSAAYERDKKKALAAIGDAQPAESDAQARAERFIAQHMRWLRDHSEMNQQPASAEVKP